MLDTDRVRWLHISDFHFKAGDSYDRDVVLAALKNSLPRILDRTGVPDLVFATGDIAFSGKAAEYDQATQFFDKILAECGLDRSRLFVVPGNHDIDRSLGRGLARSLGGREEADFYFDAQPLLHVATRMSAFKTWFDDYFAGVRTFSNATTCEMPELIDVRGSRIAVYRINSAAFAFDDHDSGKLFVGRRCLDRVVQEGKQLNAHVSVAMMHHPLDWLSPVEGPQIKAQLRRAMDVVISGHLHETDAEHIEGVAGTTLHLSAGANYQTRRLFNRAMVVELARRDVVVWPLRYEDSPVEVWTIDPSVYPNSQDFTGRLLLPSRTPGQVDKPEVAVAAVSHTVRTESAAVTELKRSFEEDLFRSPFEELLYCEPRLMSRPPEPGRRQEDVASQMSVADIIADDKPYLIEGRSEYGVTSLGKRLEYEFAHSGLLVARRSARELPNYRKKLEGCFPSEMTSSGTGVLVLDDFDPDRDERLLRECVSAKWFSRIIILSVNRALRPARLVDLANILPDMRTVYLWGLSRADVRSISERFFSSHDPVFNSGMVDKVYADLLSLRIPLTPANVIMYLRVLHREGEYSPLNRVDIVGRYISDVLRHSSDSYVDAFTSKTRADIVSSLVYKMYLEQIDSFDEKYWYVFAEGYQAQVLIDFDASVLLSELIENRIFVKHGNIIYLRYSFFYEFFLGRYISARPALLERYIEGEEYLALRGVIEVISGLNPDNTSLVTRLTERLERHLNEFADKYVKPTFDPLSGAIWPDDSNDEEEFWAPIAAQIEAGPRSTAEIDLIKASIDSEARTAVQTVTFTKFVEMENALFTTVRVLEDALKNADDVARDVKIRAFNAIRRGHLVAFQIGATFSALMVERPYFAWGGIEFLDFHKAAEGTNGGPEAQIAVITALNYSIALTVSERLAAKKLSAIFRTADKEHPDDGFLTLLTFSCVVGSRGVGWEKAAYAILERTDKNAYYLSTMLDTLMNSLRNEVVSSKDRDLTKRLVAYIQAKRGFNKQAPGAKAVDKMLEHLESIDHFAPMEQPSAKVTTIPRAAPGPKDVGTPD